jgi:hypothetical protein
MVEQSCLPPGNQKTKGERHSGKNWRQNMPFKGTPPISYFLQLAIPPKIFTTSQYPIKLAMQEWINPLIRMEPSETNHLPKAPHLNPAALGTKSSTQELLGDSFQTITTA